MAIFKSLIFGLLVILALLEYRFWLGSDSILKVQALKKTLMAQEQELQNLRQRNAQLSAHIDSLKRYPVAIEEQARNELGMIKKNEKYYQVVEPIN